METTQQLKERNQQEQEAQPSNEVSRSSLPPSSHGSVKRVPPKAAPNLGRINQSMLEQNEGYYFKAGSKRGSR